MKTFNWSSSKNESLKLERNISFEAIILAISSSLLDIIEHPNQDCYPNQRIFIVKINNYVWLVPFVEDKEQIFLKTIIPSRKATKKYLGDKNYDEP
jgi:uncharacterized DUF497 family protein